MEKGSVEDLFEEARRDVGDAARVERVAERLGGLLDAPATKLPFWKGKAFLGAVAVGIGVAALMAMRGGRPVTPPVAPQAVASAPLVLPSSEPPAPVAIAAPVVSAVVTARPVTRPVAAPSVDPVVEEHALLAQARRELDSNPTKTLTLVQEHERRFPDGILSSEREFLRISALARLGRTAEARAARDRFVATWPQSAYRDQIDRLVAP